MTARGGASAERAGEDLEQVPPARPRSRRALGSLALAVALLSLLAGASPALAGEGELPETLDVPWVGSGPGSVNVVSDGTTAPAQMTYRLDPAGFSTQTWSFSTTAGSTGTKELAYSYSGFHAWFEVTAFLRAFVTHEGVTTYTPLVSAGPADCCSAPSGGFSYAGHVALSVQSGDTYGFEFGGANGDSNNVLEGTLRTWARNEPPLNAELPQLKATSYEVGEEVTATNGAWLSESGEVSYSYQWLRCRGESCEEIIGATAPTFVPDPNDVGWTLRLRVTAHNGVGASSAESAPTSPIPEVDWLSYVGPSIGTEAADLSGFTELAADAGGQQLPPFSELCAQWRRPGAVSWSQQCLYLFVSVEFSTGCTDVEVESVFCQEEIEIGGLEPGTEYESRLVLDSDGEEVPSSVILFATEGEGLPRVSSGPQLSGDWIAGETMEVTSLGSWSGIEPFTYAEVWESCVKETEVCHAIPGSESSTYLIPAEEVAKVGESPYTLRYKLTATNEHGSASAMSEEHEVLAAPASFRTAGPVLSGEAIEGETLTITDYEIGGYPTPSVSYRWERCDTEGGGCEAIGGANGSSYVLGFEDIGHTIRAVVQASNAEYQGGAEVSEETTQTALVAAASAGQLPVNSEPPEVEAESGEGYYVGAELDGSEGSWQAEGETLTYSYQWLRCDAGGGSCEEIAGATAPTYEPTAPDVTHTLRLQVTAHDGAGETSAQSGPTPVIPEILEVETRSAEDVTADAATLPGEVELVGEGGDTVPLGAEGCVQWRGAGSGSWSEQCGPLEAGDCSAAGAESFSCQTSVVVGGLAPAGEYEYRYLVSARGEEQAGSTWTFSTEGEAPTALSGPTLAGGGVAGETMEVTSPGSWGGSEPISYGYSWERCVEETHVCAVIAGANAPTYQIPVEDVTKTSESPYTLRAKVTATNAYGEEAVFSREQDVLAEPAAFTTADPLLSGDAKEGETLTIAHYVIAGDPTPAVSYEWRRCDTGGASCEEISGAHGASYVLGSEDVGHTLRAVVSASNDEYLNGAEVSETTAQSAVVAANVLACAPGSYSLSGDEPCTQATPGHYVEGSGATAQTPCLAGTYDAAPSSTSSSACLPDPLGSYSGAGAGSATLCAVGSYAGETGAVVCTPASLGYYVASIGAAEQAPCPAGSFAEVTGSTGCTTTPPDTYSTGAAASPTPCPAGTESPAGASFCTATPSEQTQEPPLTESPEQGAETNAPEQGAAQPAPVVSGLSIKHRCVAPGVLTISANGARPRSNRGLSIGFHLNEAAQVTYTVSRRRGSPRWTSCPTSKGQGRTRGRYERISSRSRARGPGVNTQTLTLALIAARARVLIPGTYELTVTAVNAEGERSAPVSVSFWVVGKRHQGRR